MKNYYIQSSLILFSILISFFSLTQFTPNYSQNYFTQVEYWDNFYYDLREQRLSQGIESMQGTGFSSYAHWKENWALYVPSSGDFNEAFAILNANVNQQKLDHFRSYSESSNNTTALSVASTTWTEIGPKNSADIKRKNGNEWINPHNANNGTLSFGGSAGKIDRLFQHPTNQNTLYAAAGGGEAGGGGLFVSYNQGLNWQILGTDQIPIADVMAFAVKPTGVYPSPELEILFIGLSSGAVYRSIDNGINWIEAGYNGISTYPIVFNNNSLNSLPYSNDFINDHELEVLSEIEFARKVVTDTEFSRIIVSRKGGLYYSDNYYESLIPNIQSNTLANNIIWKKFNTDVILNTLPYNSSSAVSREVQFCDFESFKRNGGLYYVSQIAVKEFGSELDESGHPIQIGRVRQYVLFSSNGGVSWSFLGGLNSINSPHNEEVLKKGYFYGNIEALKNDPLYIYAAASSFSGTTDDLDLSFSLRRYNLETEIWEDFSENSGFDGNNMPTQPNAFAINPANEENWWFYTNEDIRISSNGILTSLNNLTYSGHFHADIRDILIMQDGLLLAATDGGIYKSTDGGILFNCFSNGINATQTRKMAVAQKAPYYIASGVWHAGLQAYNPETNEWHWADMSDGALGEIFFLNNEIFSKSDQYYNVEIFKNFNQLTEVFVGGGETIGSENISGRAYGIKRTTNNLITERLQYTNDDYITGSSGIFLLPFTFKKFKSYPIIIPNEPDKLIVAEMDGADYQKLHFFSGCNQTTPVLSLDETLDLNLVYDPSGTNKAQFRKIIFDPRRNGICWIILKSTPTWGAGPVNRIVEYNYITHEVNDITFVTDDVINNSTTFSFPDWFSISDIELDRQTGILYIATQNGVYYLDEANSIWRKYSKNIPLFNISLGIVHCTGEFYASSTNRGIWKSTLIRNEDTPAKEWKITQSQTWTTRMNLFCTLVVEPNVILTVKGDLVVYGDQKIIVKPGGQLILDGGKITSECGSYWAGIEIWGNSNLAQNTTNQGYLITKNNAIIEYAKEAVQVWKPSDWSKTGGVIQATNTTFKNNWRSIAYMPYHNYSATSGNEIMNKGRIVNCEFIWDDNFIGTAIAPAITMNHVNGILIQGSDFKDNRTGITNPHDRPRGIFTIDAGFKVQGRNLGLLGSPVHHDYSENNYDVCYFKNLQQGIVAMNSSSQFSVTVDHCKFEDMINGVVLRSVDNALVTRNKFDYTSGHPSDINVMNQLALDKCTGYKVEGNLFTNEVENTGTTGTLVFNSGFAQNQVFRNDYNNLYTGNYSNGQNTNDINVTGILGQPSGLQFLCNDNLNVQRYDEYVYTYPNVSGNGQGIRLKQGTSTQPTGNTFSTITLGTGKAHIKSDDLDNLFYYSSTTPAEIPTVVEGNVNNIINNIEKTCASTFNNIIIGNSTILSTINQSQLLVELQNVNTSYQTKGTELVVLLSTGNSPYLHSLISNLTPNNKQMVKTKLLENSPYLSKELLMELGNKPQGKFPPSWYKDVIIANIEVALDGDFMNYLKTKENPLPIGLYNEINNARFNTITQRGIKMDELTNLTTRKTEILDLLIQNELSNEDEINWAAYSNYVIQREDIICRSQMADMYLGKQDINQCNDKLDEIDIHINDYMVEEIRQEMMDYSIFKKYLLSIALDNGIIEKLNPGQITQLEYIAANFKGKSAVQARNLLCFHTGFCDEIEVVYAPSTKSLSIIDENEETNADLLINSLDKLKIIPNPNTGEFKLLVPEKCAIEKLEIIDIHGKNIAFELLENIENQALISVKKTSSGIYMIQANCIDGTTFISRLLMK